MEEEKLLWNRLIEQLKQDIEGMETQLFINKCVLEMAKRKLEIKEDENRK